ncbi:MAG TPA: hypothetical protein VGX23_04325 [Actinocrinis sp.]|nr:hypothetical protein [Actinocrinis sp.]
MIAVALGVIAAVLMLTAGIVTSVPTPDYLTFFGASIRTTSAQIFLIGAICTWALLVASWLLTVGIRRSRARGVQLAEARRRAGADRAGRIRRGHDADGEADTLVLTGLADGPGLRGRPNWQPTAEDWAHSQPVEE